MGVIETATGEEAGPKDGATTYPRGTQTVIGKIVVQSVCTACKRPRDGVQLTRAGWLCPECRQREALKAAVMALVEEAGERGITYGELKRRLGIKSEEPTP